MLTITRTRPYTPPPSPPNQPTTTTHTLAAADIGKFQETVGSLIGTVLELSQAVETQKLKAIGARNLKQSLEQDRHAEKMQLEAQIGEKQAHLERLRIEHQALPKVQFEQEQVGSVPPCAVLLALVWTVSLLQPAHEGCDAVGAVPWRSRGTLRHSHGIVLPSWVLFLALFLAQLIERLVTQT